jgi:hypothetical protein
MTAPPTPSRRHRAAMRSLWIASAAAFAGGVGVVLVQYALGRASANYPPVVHALSCEAEGERNPPPLTLHGEGGNMVPIFEFTVGTRIACHIEAPGADYAAWSVQGPSTGQRAGVLDPSLPCQSREDFANQSAADLRLSPCQTIRVERPGLYLLSVTALVRGNQAVDRARIALRILPAPSAEPDEPHTEQFTVTLRQPPSVIEQVREENLSASFGEHGLLPQSRNFDTVVYRLAEGETYVSSAFRLRSASNASAVRLSYNARQRAVVASYTLKSGPLIDRYRGWITGTVEVKVKREIPAREVTLPVANLALPGSVELPLPDDIAPERSVIELRKTGAEQAFVVQPGIPSHLPGAAVTIRLHDGKLILDAQPAAKP